MTDRRGRDGERSVGAWETPAVVVRAPDGSIVTPGADPGPPAGGPATRAPARGLAAGAPASGSAAKRSRAKGSGAKDGPAGGPAKRPGAEGPPATAPARPRVRPRRIPGAPGSVLVTPTLRPDAADGREERRRRRAEAPTASVTPLPPRPRPRDDADDPAPGATLRPVGAGRAPVSGRGARRPSPARPGEPRRQRVTQAVAALNLDRLLPADQEARDRRRARLRRVGTRVGSVTLALLLIYALFPVRTYLNQRSATDRARQQIDVLSRENERLAERADELRDEEAVEEIARRELGLVMPGEESYGVFPAPAEESPAPTTTTAPGD